jgi:replicative superfamily II helicase
MYEATSIGKISSMFYFSPFDVSDLKKNFSDLFTNNNQDNDHWLSMALGNIDSQRMNIISKAEKDEMSLYAEKVRQLFGNPANFEKSWFQAAVKAGFCYYQLLNGNYSSALAAIQRNLQFDYNRLSQVLIALDTMGCKWGRVGWFRGVEQRIANGVPMYLVDLCRIPNIGKVRAKKLYDAGVKTAEAVAGCKSEALRKLLNMKADAIEQIIEEAKKVDFLNDLLG